MASSSTSSEELALMAARGGIVGGSAYAAATAPAATPVVASDGGTVAPAPAAPAPAAPITPTAEQQLMSEVGGPAAQPAPAPTPAPVAPITPTAEQQLMSEVGGPAAQPAPAPAATPVVASDGGTVAPASTSSPTYAILPSPIGTGSPNPTYGAPPTTTTTTTYPVLPPVDGTGSPNPTYGEPPQPGPSHEPLPSPIGTGSPNPTYGEPPTNTTTPTPTYGALPSPTGAGSPNPTYGEPPANPTSTPNTGGAVYPGGVPGGPPIATIPITVTSTENPGPGNDSPSHSYGNTPMPSGDDTSGTTEGTPYIIKHGDTLDGIAAAHDTNLSDIEKNNPKFDANPNLIFPGQTVDFPTGSTYPPPDVVATSAQPITSGQSGWPPSNDGGATDPVVNGVVEHGGETTDSTGLGDASHIVK